MKQAILITAYKNFDHLLQLIDFFDENFNIYLHIDSKSFVPEECFKKMNKRKNVQLLSQEYDVNWGGLNHLRSILHLSEAALKEKENYFFHLISGHDYPTKPLLSFLDFFEKHKDVSFLESHEVPKVGWADNGGLDRLLYYNLYDILNSKDNKQNGWIRRIVRFQKKFGFKRKLSEKFPTLYGGSTWWSLNRVSLEYVIKYTGKHNYFLKRFRHTLCSEEFYFQSILLNSPHRNIIKNKNLRYIDWIARNGNNPAILDLTDLEKILKEQDIFFARKFETPISDALLYNIKTYLSEEGNLLNKSIKQ